MNELSSLSLGLAVFAPVLLVALWPVRAYRSAAVHWVPWTALPALLVALTTPVGTTLDVEWLVLGTRFGLDDTGRVFLFFTALLWGLGGAYGLGYLADDPGRERFFGFFLLAMTGNLGLILALDIVGFYGFFALMSFASYGLVIHTRTADALRAGRVYIQLVVLGEVMLFAGFAIMVGVTSSLGLPIATDVSIPRIALALVLLGFGIKAGLLPLHVWLPLAHPVAPTPASAILSGAMIKAGLLGWMRFLPSGQEGLVEWGGLLMSLGLAAAFFGVIAGLMQRNPKAVLAYSSISQMGLITVAVGAGWLTPEYGTVAQTAVLFYALHHGLAKGALFLAVGVAEKVGARGRGWVGAGLVVPALALAGAPLTGGAVAKVALKDATGTLPASWPEALGWLLALASVGTTLLMARFLALVWPQGAGKGQPSPALWLPWAVLVAAVAAGLFVWPAAGEASRASLAPAKLWAAGWPVAAGALIAFAVWRRGRIWAKYATLPEGDLLILLDRIMAWLRAPGPGHSWVKQRAAVATKMGDFIAPFAKGLVATPLSGLIERRLRRWPVGGAVLLLLTMTLVALLAAG